jgi:dihydrofolate reductase
MGKLVVTEFISLDGVMEDPGGAEGFKHGGWTFEFETGEAFGTFKFNELVASDAQLLGRVTYEGFAKAWPTMEGTGEFGEKMNSMPKYVVTSTLEELEWENSSVLRGDVAEEVQGLKAGEGGPILVAGSRTLAQELLRLGLVDELRLMVFPVVLGSGDRLFPESPEKLPLALTDTQAFATGVQVNTYRPRSE